MGSGLARRVFATVYLLYIFRSSETREYALALLVHFAIWWGAFVESVSGWIILRVLLWYNNRLLIVQGGSWHEEISIQWCVYVCSCALRCPPKVLCRNGVTCVYKSKQLNMQLLSFFF